MKNLSIKKVALGIFLAGYAATSAYADFSPAVANAPIQGNAPVIYNRDGTQQRKMFVRITNDEAGNTAIGNTVHAKVGNYIHIFYKLKDADGDMDNDTDHSVANTLTVYKKTLRDTSWVQVDVNAQSRNTGEDGHIYFQITSAMAGANIIGFTLQEVTPFGTPRENKWLQVSNIWQTNPPVVIGGKEVPTIDESGPGEIDPDNPIGPIESDATRMGIFKLDARGTPIWDKNLADRSVSAGTTDPALIPKYGDKLAAVVWTASEANVGNSYPDLGETSPTDTDQSQAYTFTWSLTGTADGIAANTTENVTQGVSVDSTHKWGIIELGTNNSVYNSLNGGAYKAGIQGFQLQVEAR
ncbi:hypothetical protein DKK70_02570 [Gilliamella apicola]|uniref:Uncharacterized protein n=1 Tax=Gilliamella apicola TaxID=1196095 RepID=A0A2V4E4Q6_9GAMM|nr:hypothetical protein [Gilliamella apicola]PXZ08242.1 hypothetical protein DKK70_02570 [Gilliamella apicola]